MTKKGKGGRNRPPRDTDLSEPPNRTEYRATRKVVVRGATAPDGTPWVEIAAQNGSPAVWVKLDDLSDDASSAKRRMRAGGIHLFKGDLSQALDKARNVDDFPPAPLIERPGWSVPYFALLSGEVFSPDQVEEPIILFEPNPHKCAATGDETWRKGMKRLCRGQPIVTFALMLPFCAPILRLSPRVLSNFGVELSGPKARGKSTLQRAAASTVGPVLDPAGHNYWITANTTMNALEAQMPPHNDMPMFIEEMSSMYAGESDRMRANHSREMVFRMTEGTGKDRAGAARQAPARFVYLTSTNDPIATLMSVNAGDAADAATDRLLALPISPERKHGIFEDELPKGYRSGEAAARAIDALVGEHYGQPMRVFLRALVKARAEDEGALRRDIEAYIVEFRAAVGVVGNQGEEPRVANEFGLIYAAARLARRYGALPKSLSYLDAAVYCHRLNRLSVGTHVSNLERLRQLARREDVVEVNLEDETKAYRKLVEKAPALILVGKQGKRELLVTLEALQDLFPRLRALVTDPEVKPLMRCERDRNSRQVTVIRGRKKQRFFCMRLPDDDD